MVLQRFTKGRLLDIGLDIGENRRWTRPTHIRDWGCLFQIRLPPSFEIHRRLFIVGNRLLLLSRQLLFENVKRRVHCTAESDESACDKNVAS